MVRELRHQHGQKRPYTRGPHLATRSPVIPYPLPAPSPVCLGLFLCDKTLYIRRFKGSHFTGPCVAEEMSMALKSMSIEKLVALKGQIEVMLSSKVLEQRRALESELSKLGRFQT